jgi:hypothetical protein
MKIPNLIYLTALIILYPNFSYCEWRKAPAELPKTPVLVAPPKLVLPPERKEPVSSITTKPPLPPRDKPTDDIADIAKSDIPYVSEALKQEPKAPATKKESSTWIDTLINLFKKSPEEKEITVAIEKKYIPAPIVQKAFIEVAGKLGTESIERIGKILNPNKLTEADKKLVIDLGNKLLDIKEGDYKDLPLEEKRKMLLVVKARTLQLQAGEKIAAGIGESRKGVARAIENFKASEIQKGTSKNDLNKMINKKFGPELKKLDADLKLLTEKFGFVPEKQADLLTKANEIDRAIGGEVRLKESEERLKTLLTQKSLTSEQKKTLNEELAKYPKDFLEVHNKTPKENQSALVQASKFTLQKARTAFLKKQKEAIKFIDGNISSTKKRVQKAAGQEIPRLQSALDGYIQKKKTEQMYIDTLESLLKK